MFASRKSFSCCDEYRLQEAPNRNVRRAMEKENKKFRDAARQEFNETVRQLVAYVRKRDRRLILLEAKNKEEQERRERDRLEQQQLLRNKQKSQQTGVFVQQEWADVESQLQMLESEYGQEDQVEELFCVACEKSFKNERQFVNLHRG